MEFLPTGLGKSLIFQMLRTLNVLRSLYCHAVVMLIIKGKVEELSNIGIKTFAIGTGDEEVIDEGATTGGDRTVGESFRFCCPGVEPGFSHNRLMRFVLTDFPNDRYS